MSNTREQLDNYLNKKPKIDAQLDKITADFSEQEQKFFAHEQNDIFLSDDKYPSWNEKIIAVQSFQKRVLNYKKQFIQIERTLSEKFTAFDKEYLVIDEKQSNKFKKKKELFFSSKNPSLTIKTAEEFLFREQKNFSLQLTKERSVQDKLIKASVLYDDVMDEKGYAESFSIWKKINDLYSQAQQITASVDIKDQIEKKKQEVSEYIAVTEIFYNIEETKKHETWTMSILSFKKYERQAETIKNEKYRLDILEEVNRSIKIATENSRVKTGLPQVQGEMRNLVQTASWQQSLQTHQDLQQVVESWLDLENLTADRQMELAHVLAEIETNIETCEAELEEKEAMEQEVDFMKLAQEIPEMAYLYTMYLLYLSNIKEADGVDSSLKEETNASTSVSSVLFQEISYDLGKQNDSTIDLSQDYIDYGDLEKALDDQENPENNGVNNNSLPPLYKIGSEGERIYPRQQSYEDTDIFAPNTVAQEGNIDDSSENLCVVDLSYDGITNGFETTEYGNQAEDALKEEHKIVFVNGANKSVVNTPAQIERFLGHTMSQLATNKGLGIDAPSMTKALKQEKSKNEPSVTQMLDLIGNI